jgi:hypothetical protein
VKREVACRQVREANATGGAPSNSQKGSSGEMEMNKHKHKETHQEEVDRNYQRFKELLPSILEKHAGKFALMRHGEIVEFYATAADAMRTGRKFYDDGLFSIQKVTAEPEDLGFFSHAPYSRAV